MMINVFIGLLLLGLGVAMMPHPHFVGGNEVVSTLGIYGGCLFLALAYLNHKNWL